MLTNEQLATLKVDILADATLTEWAATGRMAEEIAAEYNKAAAPATLTYEGSITYHDVNAALALA